ncbi:MAG: poly-beta-hydroxybutyrate polymerase, partial [Pusillimonas sp.]
MKVADIRDKPASASPEDNHPDVLDTLANAWRARSTGGLSPAAGLLAWYDWALHLSLSPGKQRGLLEKGLHKQQRLARYAVHAASAQGCPTCVEPLEQDQRFASPAWQRWPYNVIHQNFL